MSSGTSSVQFSFSVISDSLWPHEPQHARPPCPSPTPRVYPNSCPLSWWCHPAISFSVIPFSSCPQSLPASGCFQMSQLFTSGGQSIGVSASASVLPVNTQDWSPLGWTGWITLQSKGLSRVSNTTVQKHQFFNTQLFIVQLSHPYMTTGKTMALTSRPYTHSQRQRYRNVAFHAYPFIFSWTPFSRLAMTFLCPQLYHMPMPKLNTAKGNCHDWISLIKTHLLPPQLRGDPVSPNVHVTLMSYMSCWKATHHSLCNEKKPEPRPSQRWHVYCTAVNRVEYWAAFPAVDTFPLTHSLLFSSFSIHGKAYAKYLVKTFGPQQEENTVFVRHGIHPFHSLVDSQIWSEHPLSGSQPLGPSAWRCGVELM